MENTEKEKRFVILGKTSNGGGGGGGEGTVTSVGISVPTGLNVIGSPVTSSGIIQIGFANGYSIPTTAKQAEWDAKSDFSGSYNDLTNKPTLATVATSGDYDDLTNKPTIPSKTSDLTNDSGFVVDTSLSSVATSGDYDDLSNKPTIPTVNDATITITQGGVTKGTFTTNQSGNSTIALDAGGGSGTQVQSDWTETDSTSMAYILHKPTIPTKTSDLTNDSGFISQLKTINNESLIGTGNLTIDTFSGDYNDLTNKPTIPTKTSDLTNDSGFVVGSTLATVATSGSYNDLTNKPTIPTVGNGTITITQGGTTKGTFTLNQSGNATITLDSGGSGGGDVTAAGNNTFTGINSFMNDVFIGGFTEEESGSIAEEDYSLNVNSVNGSTYIGINLLSMSNTRGNQFSLDLTEEFDEELQDYNLHTDIQTYNLNIVNPTEGATASVSIDGYQVLTTNDVATVATSGSYNDLSDTPTIPTNTSDLTNDSGFINQLKTINNESLIGTGNITIGSGGTQVQSDWTETDITSMAYILHKPTLSIVATTGDYDDLTNKPTIPTNTSDLTNDSGFISQIKTINNESLIGTGNLTIDTFSGDYNDLTNKPTIPTKTSDLTNDSNFVVGSTLATVATSGSYNDLSNTPTIPTVNDSTITITQGGTTKGTFTLNQSSNATITLDAGGGGGSTRDTWYGSQAQFDAIPENQLDENTDYYISGNVQWNDIAGKPIIPTNVSQLENDSEYTQLSTVKKEINKALRVFGDRVQYVTQSEFDSLSQSGTLKDDVTYFIQDSTDNTIQMDVVFSDNTTATYNVYINN